MKILKQFSFTSILLITTMFSACSGDTMGEQSDSPVTNDLIGDGPDRAAPIPGKSGFIEAASITANSAVLKWGAARDERSAQLNLVYAVYQSKSDKLMTVSDWETADLVQDFTTGSLSAAIRDLSASTTYYFNVVVRDTAGNKSLYSAKQLVTTAVVDSTAPEAGNGGTITAGSISADSLVLSWTAGSDNITEQSDLQYAVYKSASNDICTLENCESKGSMVRDFSSAMTSINISGLPANSCFHFNVVVQDSAGNKALYSIKQATTTADIDTAPPVAGNSGVIATECVTGNSLVLNWTAGNDNITEQNNLQYAVYISASNDIYSVENCENNGMMVQNFKPAVTTYNVTGVPAETTYYFTVLVKDAAGNKTVYKTLRQTTGEAYVPLNMHLKNTITRGRKVFEAVMKKYQPVINFYKTGTTDTKLFQSLVNTNLLSSDTENLTPPEEKLFNYILMKEWGNTEFIVEYEDGTRAVLPAAECLLIAGGTNPKWIKDGKKIVNFLVKFKKAEEYRVKILANAMNTSNWQVKHKVSFLGEKTGLFSGDMEGIKRLSSICIESGKYSGYMSLAFDTAQAAGFIDMGPGVNYIPNKNPEYLITAIEGIYSHLDYIESRLNRIEAAFSGEAIRDRHRNLRNLMNLLRGELNAVTSIVINTESDALTQKALAVKLYGTIDGRINAIINTAIDLYNDTYLFMENNSENPDYKELEIEISTPYLRGWSAPNPDIETLAQHPYILKSAKVDCKIAKFKMCNPNKLLPFNPEIIGWIKDLLKARVALNSFIFSRDAEALNGQNSIDVYNYIKEEKKDDKGNLIQSGGKIFNLRKSVYWSYVMLKPRITDRTYAIINGTTGQTVQKNLSSLINLNIQNKTIPYASCKDPDTIGLPANGSLVDLNYPPDYMRTWNWVLEDKFGYTPYFNKSPYLTVENGKCKNFLANHDHSYINVFHTYPYPPTIKFMADQSNVQVDDGSYVANTPVAFEKKVDEPDMLADVNSAIDIYYKARTQQLLEFTASLAALEIELALYLDDTDYKKYDPGWVE